MSAHLHPVLSGAHLDVYSLARAYHEAYGATSTTLTVAPRGFINDSGIVTPRFIPRGTADEIQLEAYDAEAAAATQQGKQPVLVANNDGMVDLVNRHRSQLEQDYTLLVAEQQHVDAVVDKSALAAMAKSVGLRTPREVVIEPGQSLKDQHAAIGSLEAPFIVKPAESSQWEYLAFEGKKKVYVCDSAAEVIRIAERAHVAGFVGKLLVQELIPGDDTHNYIATTYIDRGGVATLQATARMLLAVHTPNLLGNMAMGLVKWYPQIAEPVTNMLQARGYHGFATVDIKAHSRTGELFLLDINPRVGRSLHFISIGGINPIQVAMDDLQGVSRPAAIANTQGLFTIVPSFLVRRYVTEPGLRAEVRRVRRAAGWSNPLDYRPDRNVKRAFYRRAAAVNQMRNLLAVYPRPTETAL